MKSVSPVVVTKQILRSLAKNCPSNHFCAVWEIEECRILGVIYSVSSFLNRESLMTLYYSLVYSHINQSIVIWGGASEKELCYFSLLNISTYKTQFQR